MATQTAPQTSNPYTGVISSQPLPDTAQTGQENADTQTGVLQPTSKPGVQQDINTVLEPYINELMNLGPEYQEEMNYLAPYLTGTGAGAPETFQGLENQSKSQESSTGNTAVNAADTEQGEAIANQQAPGFGQEAQAAQEYEQTVPYSQLLQTVLGAGKNEILYGTTPNISNISTKGWPESLQNAYQFLTQAATGTNASTGLQSPTAAAQAAKETTGNSGSSSANLQGGGNG